MSDFEVEPAVVDIVAELLDKDSRGYGVQPEFLEAGKAMAQRILAEFPVPELITAFDILRIERLQWAYILGLECNFRARQEPFQELEFGSKEHPAGAAGRAYSNQLHAIEKEMLKRLEELPVGGKAGHGNTKKVNPALRLIAGS